MRLNAIVCIICAALLNTTVSAQTVSGRIVDKRAKPIATVIVKLQVKGGADTTNNTGVFSINATSINAPHSSSNLNRTVSILGQNLFFYNESPQKIKIELFDMKGKRASNVFNKLFPEGSYSFSISSLISQKSANGLYITRITRGNETHTLPFSPLGNSKTTAHSPINDNRQLAKQLATADSLIVTKEGYITVSRALDSDVTQDLGDIQLNLVNDPDAAIEAKVTALLGQMTPDEKIAQTAEVLVDIISTNDLKTNMYGSVFNGGGYPFTSNTKETWKTNLDAMHDAAKQSRLGIPILYGIDAVHGLGTIEGATVFPHNIGMGCTGDTALVAKMANVTAKECRALGINLNFGPAISVVRNERWGRSYEGYGETPEINSLMAAAYVRGLQGNGNMASPEAVAACAKHFLGDGGTTNGENGGVTNLSEATIRAIHLPPYQAAVSEQVSSVMPSYNAWNRNGQQFRCTNDKYSLTTMLKEGLKWDGFCLSDWDAIMSATASTVYDNNNVSAAINAGIDMAMIAKIWEAKDLAGKQKEVKDYIAALKATVSSNTVAASRLDDAVKRILRIKYRLNLFENAKSNSSLFSEFGSAAHRAIARECVRKSLVLLKNEGNALPLLKTEKVVVVGPYANKMGAQCGGWTISWQGSIDHTGIMGTTILAGLQSVGGSNVTFDETGNNLGSADKIVLVIGEAPYAEGTGDHGHTNSTLYNDCPQCLTYNNSTMSINLADCPNRDLLNKCFSSPKPVIVVLLSGRPMIITQEITKAKAFVAAWLPGSEGGGVADVLYKEDGATFTGKLTHTWPGSFEQIPINSGTAYTDEQKGSGGTPLFPYGHGLTY